jgi:hypothetical protein
MTEKTGAPQKTLLDEIVELASGDKVSVASLLRKCLVLAHALRNDRLKAWTEDELNGYKADDDAVPDYRKTVAIAKGFFIGSFGRQLNDQPIPPAILREQHRHFAESMVLFQPIASYEGVGGDSQLVFEWPPNLTALYQASFFQKQYLLNRAWQEVPGSVFVGLIDTIRTRVLRFALDLRDELGPENDNLNELPKEKVDQSVITYIFGGNNVIASRDFAQTQSIEVGQGDWAALARALEGLGVKTSEIAQLQSALNDDSKAAGAPSLGQRTFAWLKQLSSKLGQTGMNIGIEVAKTEVTKWLHQYLG